MVFDLEEKPATRFEVDGGGWVELRTLSVEDWQKIRKACVTKRPFAHRVEEPGPGGKPSVTWMVLNQEITNEELQVEMINDLIIHAWGDLKDKSANQIPCTKDNKMRLMIFLTT